MSFFLETTPGIFLMIGAFCVGLTGGSLLIAWVVHRAIKGVFHEKQK